MDHTSLGLTKDEMREVAHTLSPHRTDEQFERDWSEMMAKKRSWARQLALTGTLRCS